MHSKKHWNAFAARPSSVVCTPANISFCIVWIMFPLPPLPEFLTLLAKSRWQFHSWAVWFYCYGRLFRETHLHPTFQCISLILRWCFTHIFFWLWLIVHTLPTPSSLLTYTIPGQPDAAWFLKRSQLERESPRNSRSAVIHMYVHTTFVRNVSSTLFWCNYMNGRPWNANWDTPKLGIWNPSWGCTSRNTTRPLESIEMEVKSECNWKSKN